MFELGSVAASDRQQVLAELRRKMGAETPLAPVAPPVAATRVVTAPVIAAPAARRVLTVPEPLAGILPGGGLPCGGVVSLRGAVGSTSLLFTLLAAPANTWSALVGMPDIGLLAAAELGVDLDRTVLIPDPGPDVLQVLSVLADGVDIVAVAPPRGSAGLGLGVTPARRRVLTARLRQSGAVLLVAGQWPGADLVLDSRIESWTGLGQGYGRLRDRQLVVEVAGRGAAGRRRSAVMFLRSSRSGVDVGAVPARLGSGGLDHGLDSVVAEVG